MPGGGKVRDERARKEEDLNELEVLQEMRDGCGGNDEEAAARSWRNFPQQDEQSLQDLVGESVADGRVLDQALNVIDEDDGEGRAVSIVEDLMRAGQARGGQRGGDLEQELTLLVVLHPDHGVRRDEADQREIRLHSKLSGDGSLRERKGENGREGGGGGLCSQSPFPSHAVPLEGQTSAEFAQSCEFG
jgi:hypothetical protein